MVVMDGDDAPVKKAPNVRTRRRPEPPPRQKQRAKRVAKVTGILMKKADLKKAETRFFAECETAIPGLGMREFLEGLKAARAQNKKKRRTEQSRK